MSNQEPCARGVIDAPTTAPSRRYLRASVLALALLVGCGAQRIPTSYTGSVEKNFKRACESQGRSEQVSDIKNVCACTYKQIKKTIKFSRFKKINSDLTDKPGSLPSDMAKIVDGCTQGTG